jgi:hypothetical protein
MSAPATTIGVVGSAREQISETATLVKYAPSTAPARLENSRAFLAKAEASRKNDEHFLSGPSSGREWWRYEARRRGSDWDGVISLALEIAASMMPECDRCRYWLPELKPTPQAAKPRPQPTPPVVVDAILYSVAARGPRALQEPANRERLSRCDKAAIQEIDRRMAKIGGGK